MLELQKKCYS